jgi:hypothetical protein
VSDEMSFAGFSAADEFTERISNWSMTEVERIEKHTD